MPESTVPQLHRVGDITHPGDRPGADYWGQLAAPDKFCVNCLGDVETAPRCRRVALLSAACDGLLVSKNRASPGKFAPTNHASAWVRLQASLGFLA